MVNSCLTYSAAEYFNPEYVTEPLPSLQESDNFSIKLLFRVKFYKTFSVRWECEIKSLLYLANAQTLKQRDHVKTNFSSS